MGWPSINVGDRVTYRGDIERLLLGVPADEISAVTRAIRKPGFDGFLVVTQQSDGLYEIELPVATDEVHYFFVTRPELHPIGKSGEPFVGAFIRIGSLVDDFRYAPAEEAIRRSASGRIGRVAEPCEGSSDNGLTTRDGWLRVDYTYLSKDGVQSYGVHVADDFEILPATEEMVLLHSLDVWQLLRPFGEPQDTPTYARLADAFGVIDLAQASEPPGGGCTSSESSPS